MTYTVTKGISESELSIWLEKAYEKYGYYKGKAVNYSKADIAPVVMITVTCQDDLLLVKRGFGLADAEGYWSSVNGFIDEIKPVKEIASQELKEELGIDTDKGSIEVAESYIVNNPKEKRKYIVFPCLVKLKQKPKIVLNSANVDYAWIKRDQLESYYILDDLPYAVDRALELNKR